MEKIKFNNDFIQNDDLRGYADHVSKLVSNNKEYENIILRYSIECILDYIMNKNTESLICITYFLHFLYNEKDVDDIILNNEFIMGCIDHGIDVKIFIDNVSNPQEITKTFCDYILYDYEYIHNNDNFVFKDYGKSLVPLIKFLLSTDYLNNEQKLYYVSNISYKAYISDINSGCNNVYEYIKEDFFDKEFLKTDLYKNIINNVIKLDQENMGTELYDNISNRDYDLDIMQCIIQEKILEIINDYDDVSFFVNKLSKLCLNSEGKIKLLSGVINVLGAVITIQHQKTQKKLPRTRTCSF